MNKVRMVLSVLYIFVGMLYLSESKAAWGPYMAHPTNSNTVQSDTASTVTPARSYSNVGIGTDMFWRSNFSNMPRATDCTLFYTIQENSQYSDGKFNWKLTWSGLGANRVVAIKINGGTEFNIIADASGTAAYNSGINNGGGSPMISYRAKKNSGANYGTCPTSRPAFEFNHQCHAVWRPEYQTWLNAGGYWWVPGSPGYYPDPTINICN